MKVKFKDTVYNVVEEYQHSYKLQNGNDSFIASKRDCIIEDNIEHPKHYTQGNIEVINMMVSIWGSKRVSEYCEINAFKYRMRAGHKQNTEEDIKKAMWYENKAKQLTNT